MIPVLSWLKKSLLM